MKWFKVSFLLVCGALLWASGIIPAIIPQAVPLANKIGNSTKFQLGATGAVPGDCATFDASLNITGPGTAAGCGGGGGGASPVYPYQTGTNTRGTSTLVMPLPSFQNNILGVCVGWEGGAGTDASLTDSAGTSYTRQTQVTGDANRDIALFTGRVPATPGTITITATIPAGAGFQGLYAVELAGITIADTLDVATSGFTAFSLTTTQKNDVILACVQGNLSIAVSSIENLGFSAIISTSTTTQDSGAIAYTLQPMAGPIYTKIFNTSSATVQGNMAIKTF